MHITERHKSVYAFIGQRIRFRRKLLKLSQTQLAEMMGFSYQQMQKYETGTSHVTAGKLVLFAKILNVPPGYFYEGIKLEEDVGKRIESKVIQKTRIEPLRVLLIEDNPDDVMFFKKALGNGSEQVDVHSIHDAEMALDFLQHHETKYGYPLPGIIVTELVMPKVSGLELLKYIKKNPKIQLVPVVVLTNSVSVKDLVEAYKLGAAGFIQKSVDLKEYTESMESVMKYWAKTVALPCAC